METSPLRHRILEVVSSIPVGHVMSYGSVARAAGSPRGARMVGWTLNSLSPESSVPWHRVVNKNAEMSIRNASTSAQVQAELLRAEGNVITSREGTLVIKQPTWWNPGESL